MRLIPFWVKASFKHNDSLKITETGMNSSTWSHRGTSPQIAHGSERFLVTRMPTKQYKQRKAKERKEEFHQKRIQTHQNWEPKGIPFGVCVYTQRSSAVPGLSAPQQLRCGSPFSAACCPAHLLACMEKGRMHDLHLHSKDTKKAEAWKV